MTGTRLEVPFQVRGLAVMILDNLEKAFELFFDAAIRPIAPNSLDPIALLKRVVAVKTNYARKLACASDLTEANALQIVYCRAQVDITTDLIRISSDSNATNEIANASRPVKLILDVL